MSDKKFTAAQQIAIKLIEMGEATAMQIARALGLSADVVSNTLRQRRKQYGISVVRVEVIRDSGNAHKKNVWTIDADVFNDHMAKLALKSIAVKPERPPKIKPPRMVSRYTWPHRTVWQACSPYKQEARA